jgi:hypothetical protein
MGVLIPVEGGLEPLVVPRLGEVLVVLADVVIAVAELDAVLLAIATGLPMMPAAVATAVAQSATVGSPAFALMIARDGEGACDEGDSQRGRGCQLA